MIEYIKMTSLRFIPIFEDKEFLDAVAEYKEIWDTENNRIVDAFKKITGLSLVEERIAAVVYEGVSFSGRTPNDIMKLRLSYDKDVKKATLIHELSHRLLFNLKNRPEGDEHKILNLFLYDVWVELYGGKFANKMVEIEKKRAENYLQAWDYALSFTKEQRQEEYTKFIASNQ